ncbi:polyprenyl synthetase [Lucifera butyrica]|uniref:Farnesyl diphosphate synthase n=1 Tax=Lucifera butyrica TaxID=1351585 RepID=A0A498RAV7_9FIRM|nr:farnesyl diphosphate synthase [Lucifera butyrica]VBB08007.1 polyprenyl synthetase [Lucifera butyrica]
MLKQYCQEKVAMIDAALGRFIPDSGQYPPAIFEAMRYSLFAGGKRLRPILLMAAADAVQSDGSKFLPVACGLEMIHTYSLIHDDLPAMDDDDYRRGKLTNHKVYGDGLAILAGDALLTYGFEVMLSQPGVAPAVLLATVREIAAAAGAQGMVGGQTVDLLSEGQSIDAATLEFMHRRKTGALFRAALRAGALLAGASQEQLNCFNEYAEQFGLAFQITDDILDVVGKEELVGKPIGSDQKNNKVTYVALYGLEKAREMARQTVEKAITALDIFGTEADILRDLVRFLLARDS